MLRSINRCVSSVFVMVLLKISGNSFNSHEAAATLAVSLHTIYPFRSRNILSPTPEIRAHSLPMPEFRASDPRWPKFGHNPSGGRFRFPMILCSCAHGLCAHLAGSLASNSSRCPKFGQVKKKKRNTLRDGERYGVLVEELQCFPPACTVFRLTQ